MAWLDRYELNTPALTTRDEPRPVAPGYFPGGQAAREFLDLLSDITRLWKIEIYAYCLMNNHYHLLLSTPAAGLSRAMRHLDGIYTQKFNRVHHRDGPLFRGRYKAILIDAEEYFLSVVRYIHKNALAARTLLRKPFEYLQKLKLIIEIVLEPRNHFFVIPEGGKLRITNLKVGVRFVPVCQPQSAMNRARVSDILSSDRPAGTGPSCNTSRHGRISPAMPASASTPAVTSHW